MIKNDKKQMWKYDIVQPGFNFRLSDINCALGISQLRKLDSFIRLRRKIAKQYNEILQIKNISTPYLSSNIYHSYHVSFTNDFNKLKIKKKFLYQNV